MWMQKHRRATRLHHRGLGSREKVGNLADVTNVCFATSPVSNHVLRFTHSFSSSFPVFLLLGGGFTLEPKRVFLCGEVCVLLVPFAWGQALFSVQVLRVYPNVQDLGVSARLSESGGAEEERDLIRNCRNETCYQDTDVTNNNL